MSMDRILESVRTFPGVLELAPVAGDGYPEIALGDHFFYWAPDGRVPQREQSYATVVTKNLPGDTTNDLDLADRRRLNIHVGAELFTELTGESPRTDAAPAHFTATDVVFAHPVYRAQGWVSIVNPGARTYESALTLLRTAHDAARRRAERRGTGR
ncbi:DUF6194 family protein [Streptomyces tardus]